MRGYSEVVRERFKLNLSELASDAKMGLLHYGATKIKDLVVDSVEEGKIFCDTLSNSIGLFQEREKCWKLNKKFFTEEKVIDLDILYFGEEFSSCLKNNNYKLDGVLKDTKLAKNLLDKVITEINDKEIFWLDKYFNKYETLISSTLSQN